MINIWAKTLQKYQDKEVSLDMLFHRRDGGDTYTQICAEENTRYAVPGILYITRSDKLLDMLSVGKDKDQVCVIAKWHQDSSGQDVKHLHVKSKWKIQGFARRDGRWQEVPVQVIPLRENLFSRTEGLYETDVLADANVLVAGLGSVGSVVTELLAMSAIINFILLDYDRVEAANICRQGVGISDIGRYKTKVAAQKILDKNPYAKVETHETKITWKRFKFLRELIRRSDIVIGSVDNREPRLILNKLCIEENKPLILMGAFHRAYGLQILFVKKPGPCYQCFLMSLPEEAKKREMSSLGQRQRIAYADRPVPKPEPGLAVDIAPMNIMTAKLCINELLKGKPTTMGSLYKDLIAPWLIYLNRREGPYEKLKPLAFNVGDGMHILSWYGIELERNKACPACGNYVGEMSKAHDISIPLQER